MNSKFKNKIFTLLKSLIIVVFSSIFLIYSTNSDYSVDKNITYMEILQKQIKEASLAQKNERRNKRHYEN